MMDSPVAILFGMVVNFALLIVFIRFMFQLANIPKTHPYGRGVYMLSAVVTLFSRIFPDLNKGQFSTSAVVLMLLLIYIQIAGFASIEGKSLTPLLLFFGGTLRGILHFVDALKYIIIASVVCSWIILLANKMHPVMDLIMQMSEPIVAPFRRFTPNLGMIDLSVLVAIMSLSMIEIVIRIVGGNILKLLV
ncbi:YggT family protein [Moraxella oblonga]|uniref:YggT family protein n=1 Tax=Moraxella oblonga TaxID=200413 RepID=UPI001FE121DD|nr:YggT family protein [Moraxella oblonga]